MIFFPSIYTLFLFTIFDFFLFSPKARSKRKKLPEPAIIWKPLTSLRTTLKEHVTSMKSTLEPAVKSCGTGQRIPYFESCQLIITWMSKIKLNTDCIALDSKLVIRHFTSLTWKGGRKEGTIFPEPESSWGITTIFQITHAVKPVPNDHLGKER